MQQELHFQICGISQDLAYQLFNPKYAFECKNIRINTTDENSLLSLSNEKGNYRSSDVFVDDEDNRDIRIIGVGQFTEYCVIFATDVGENDYTTGRDLIFLIEGTGTSGTQSLVYQGSLGFDSEHPIRTVCVYENEKVQKVYWIDGINPPRVLNIAGHLSGNSQEGIKSVNEQKIDFLPKLTFQEHVGISRTSGGQFPAGVIQYAFTYSDKNLQESNLWYVSPLYYITQTTKGAEAGSTCNVAFRMNFSGLNTSFDYMQIYAIVRTSLNATPACYRIANIPTTTTSFTDTGSQWESFSPELILGKQLGTFVPKTITSKDSTLFLGNYTLKSPSIKRSDYSSFFTSLAASTSIGFRDSLHESSAENLEEGANSLQTFRSGEHYRIGIQFQDEYGTPSSVIYLKDIQAGIADPSSAKFVQKVVNSTLPSIPEELASKFKRARLMMIDRTNLPHRTICQGLLCPTVYRVNDRVNNSPFAMSSWCMRGFDGFKNERPTWGPDTPLRGHLRLGGAEIENQLNYNGVTTNNGSILDSDIMINTAAAGQGEQTYYYIVRAGASQDIGSDLNYWGRVKLFISMSRTTDPNDLNVFHGEMLINRASFYLYQLSNSYPNIDTNQGAKSFFQNYVLQSLQNHGAAHPQRIVSDIFSQWTDKDFVALLEANRKLANVFMLGQYSGNQGARTSDVVTQSFEDALDLARAVGQPFFCDHNIITFHSPDVEKYQAIIDNNPSIKYRIVGYTDIEESYFDSYMQTSPPSTSDSQQGIQTVKKTSKAGIYNASLWKDGDTFQTYIWHRSMTLGAQKDATNEGKWYGQYTRKILSNVHRCGASLAFKNASGTSVVSISPSTSIMDSEPRFPQMGTPRVFNFDEVTALSVENQKHSLNIHDKLIYYGNVDIYHSNGTYSIPIVSGNALAEKNDSLVSDPCLIRYKSTPHVVMPMSYLEFGDPQIGNYKVFAPSLPYPALAPSIGDAGTHGYLWASSIHGVDRSTLCGGYTNIEDIGYNEVEQALLYIAELYQDLSVSDIYGTTTEENLSKYTWVPISTWAPLQENSLMVGYGDCFIGRWECLKTYAYSKDDIQSYIDITSVVLESDTNLESRCDNYKGTHNASVIDASKFNIFNPVYNQQDNLFSYRTLTSSELIDDFQNQICWSEVKTLGEELDQWCQINVGNNIDLQGEYGELRALATSNNSIFCFQDNAIYKLNYNTRVTISPSDGVPIQLTNNYKVEPPLLLKANCGTFSQDGVVNSPNNLYFLDWSRKRAFVIDERDNIQDLSGAKGVNSLLLKLGTPKKLFFDYNVNDVYFNFSSSTLCFNEDIMEFTSLYDYSPMEFMYFLGSETYATCASDIYEQRGGKYNFFFDEYKPYYVEILANEQPLKSKTFTNVEFTMASDSAEEAFNNVEVKTSYQHGEESLKFDRYKPSNLKRKLRLWRINVPRSDNSLDRMRDTWCKIKLSRLPILTTETVEVEGQEVEQQVAHDTDNNIKARVNHISVSYIPD